MHSQSLLHVLSQAVALKAPAVAPSTRKYHREIVAEIAAVWPVALVKSPAEITPEDVQEFALAAGHFSASRWNAQVGWLRRVLPAARALPRRRVGLTRPAPPSQAEFRALLAECDRLPRSRAGLVVAFLAHTGLRIAAARQVRWSDVHWDRIEYTGKGGRRGAVPLIPGLREVLARLRALDGDAEFVLPRESIRRGLEKACARAGLRRLSHHDFRHLFATRVIESGVDLPTAARWLGHQDGGALLAKRYFHLLDQHSRAMAERVAV